MVSEENRSTKTGQKKVRQVAKDKCFGERPKEKISAEMDFSKKPRNTEETWQKQQRKLARKKIVRQK